MGNAMPKIIDPPVPSNIGKRRVMTAIDGRRRYFAIEDEIVTPQKSGTHRKLICFQKIRFEEDRHLEYRFTYYMLGLKAGARGRWVFGQYSLLIPAKDLARLLKEARRRGWEGI